MKNTEDLPICHLRCRVSWQWISLIPFNRNQA